jgi:hypothetical protein
VEPASCRLYDEGGKFFTPTAIVNIAVPEAAL